MSSSIFFGGSVLAAMVAGMIALFAPCCISVMLPAYFASSFPNRRVLVAMTFLFAAGIATIIGLQSFLIIGGVTRVIPLTGISLPFVSYGGSSLVANFALLAILLRISDDSVRAETPSRAR